MPKTIIRNLELQNVYQQFSEIAPMVSRPSEAVSLDDVIKERSKYFKESISITHKFNISYSAEKYCGLMRTMSPHRSLSEEKQNRLFQKIHDVFSRFEPVVMENLVTADIYQKL